MSVPDDLDAQLLTIRLGSCSTMQYSGGAWPLQKGASNFLFSSHTLLRHLLNVKSRVMRKRTQSRWGLGPHEHLPSCTAFVKREVHQGSCYNAPWDRGPWRPRMALQHWLQPHPTQELPSISSFLLCGHLKETPKVTRATTIPKEMGVMGTSGNNWEWGF